MAFTPPPGATLGSDGFYYMPDGTMVQFGQTPAQQAATPGPVQTDANGKPYRLVSGQKWYLPPMTGPTDNGGGLIHGRTQWNPKTGQYDTPLDWGKILTMVTAGIITAGAADAILSATPALAVTAPPGASAAASAPTLEGVAAGAGGATTVPAAGSVLPSATYGAGGAVTSFAGVAPEVGGGSVAGLSYADLLKYGLPVAGNLVGNLIQAKASGAATDAQQKYLEEALAYQKESDAYARATDAARYADTRGDVAKADQRYSDYQGRILPWIQNGTSSNDRMAALLGLPARAGGASGGSSGPPASQRVAIDPTTQAAIRSELQATNSSDDPAAWDEYVSSHGDSAAKNWAYWKTRIDTGDGVGKGYAGPSSPSAPPAAAPPVTPPAPPAITTQPQARAADVQMRAPDGSVNTVPADQVDHYRSLGATLLGAAA